MQFPQDAITPTRARRERKYFKEEFAWLRSELRAVRALRKTGRILDAEEAEGRLNMAWHAHNALIARRRAILALPVVLNAHISLAAAERHAARHQR